MNLRNQPYRKRLDKLYCLPIAAIGAPIISVRTASKPVPKRAMLAELRQRNREGIVFKRIEAPHTPGRPASGGDWLKLKFTATCSCIVAGTNGSRRSVRLELLDDAGRRVGVGNVTVPPNHVVPTAGQIVEVRYLHAFPGGSLYQPVYLGQRDDVGHDACRIGQVKFKPKGGSEGEEG